MGRARRTDSNLTAIVKAARAAGFLVYVRNDELADLDVQYLRYSELWEVKTATGKYKPSQLKHRAEGWLIRTVRTVEDVLQARREIRLIKQALESPKMPRYWIRA